MQLKKLLKYKEFIGFGIGLALLLATLQLLQYKFLIISNRFEFYVGIIAILFTTIGIWIAKKLTALKTNTVFIEKEVYILNKTNFICNQIEIENLKISKRELEVLELMAKGLSNKEIAENLFVSLNTIKTHSSNLFEKLNVNRRTQAIETAKKLQIIS